MSVECGTRSAECGVVTPPCHLISSARLRLWAILLFAFLLSGCNALGRTAYQPLTFHKAPWHDGEQTVFRVTDVNGNYAGTAQFDMTSSASARWSMVREIVAQGTSEMVMVEIEAVDFRPVHSLLVRTNATGQQRVNATYEQGKVNLELVSEANVVTYETTQVTTDVRDQRTLLMIVRALPLTSGYATRVNTFYPIRGQMERVVITVTSDEQIDTPLATFDTWRVELANPRNQSQAWYGKEAPYPLVKFVDGDTGGTYELSQFTPSREE